MWNVCVFLPRVQLHVTHIHTQMPARVLEILRNCEICVRFRALYAQLATNSDDNQRCALRWDAYGDASRGQQLEMMARINCTEMNGQWLDSHRSVLMKMSKTLYRIIRKREKSPLCSRVFQELSYHFIILLLFFMTYLLLCYYFIIISHFIFNFLIQLFIIIISSFYYYYYFYFLWIIYWQ